MERITKEQFRYRMYALYVAVLAWGVSGPVLKTYFNLLSSTAIAVLSLWVMFVGLSQKYLRAKYSITSLMKMLIAVDVAYSVAAVVFILMHNIKYMLIADLVISGFYTAVTTALSNKLQSYYIGRFRPMFQDKIRATITNNKQYSAIVALILAGVLGLVFGIYQIMWIKVGLLIIVVYLELKSLKG